MSTFGNQAEYAFLLNKVNRKPSKTKFVKSWNSFFSWPEHRNEYVSYLCSLKYLEFCGICSIFF